MTSVVPGHLYLVETTPGRAEYQILTDDGRLVPAEEW